jgi:hypothetical protein
MLSEKARKDFQCIYERAYGKQISESEAMEQGTRLIELIRIIYRPIPVERLKPCGKEVKTNGNTNSC